MKCNYYLQVIAGELYRNLALAIGCITATTLVLLSSWLGCLQVVFCVLLTLTNVAGFMHFWGKYTSSKSVINYHSSSWLFLCYLFCFLGLTIETVSSTNLIISIGLCVDCPAHIAHEFLASQGIQLIHMQNTFQLHFTFFFRYKDRTKQKGFAKYGTSSAEWGLQYFFIFRPVGKFWLTCI